MWDPEDAEAKDAGVHGGFSSTVPLPPYTFLLRNPLESFEKSNFCKLCADVGA